MYGQYSEAATRSVLWKKVFLEISQNSQENTCARVSFSIKLQALGLQLYLKKGLWHRCFPVNFVKYLRTPFLQNTSERLLQALWNIEAMFEIKYKLKKYKVYGTSS